MKKFLVMIGVLLVVFCGFIAYDTYFKEEVPVLEIEEEKVNISELYVYGTHLNVLGSHNFINDAELVLYDGEFISYDLNYLEDEVINGDFNDLIDSSNNDVSVIRSFNFSDYINDGIYLDDIPVGDYYLFLRVKVEDDGEDNTDSKKDKDKEEDSYRYYSLVNESGYDETTYYTMSNYNKRIVISNEDSYPTMMMRVLENDDKEDVYDIVLDPGHGGMDGGASKNGYKETDFTMDLSLKIKEKLEGYGFKVKLTHDEGQLSSNDLLEEYGVHGRAVVSSEVRAKYLFSLHLNSSESSRVNGLEVYTAKNINYDFAKLLVNNITSLSGVGYSTNKINKIDNSIYSRNFTQDDIDRSLKNYEDQDLVAYDISTKSNYYYMIRETGGIITGAYVDDRNSEILGNPYTKNNVGTETYLMELGYLSNQNDLNNMINNMDKYVEGIAISIKSLYDDGNIDGDKATGK